MNRFLLDRVNAKGIKFLIKHLQDNSILIYNNLEITLFYNQNNIFLLNNNDNIK